MKKEKVEKKKKFEFFLNRLRKVPDPVEGRASVFAYSLSVRVNRQTSDLLSFRRMLAAGEFALDRKYLGLVRVVGLEVDYEALDEADDVGLARKQLFKFVSDHFVGL